MFDFMHICDEEKGFKVDIKFTKELDCGSEEGKRRLVEVLTTQCWFFQNHIEHSSKDKFSYHADNFRMKVIEELEAMK